MALHNNLNKITDLLQEIKFISKDGNENNN